MRAIIEQMLPEVNEIGEAGLRKQVVDVWEDAMAAGQWTREQLESIPFTLLAGDIDMRFIEHIRSCAKMCIAVVRELNEIWGDRMPIHRDHLIAGSLLADVGKLIEYEKKHDGTVIKGQRGDMLRHPFSGVGMCWKHGLPDAVMHIVATHSKEGDHVQRTPESLIFHHADFIDFDIACYLGKRR